jgi:hypothetical protein
LCSGIPLLVNTFVMLRGLRLVKLLLLSRELFFGKMGFRWVTAAAAAASAAGACTVCVYTQLQVQDASLL